MKSNWNLIFIVALLLIPVNLRITINKTIRTNNDREITRCIENGTNKFRIKGNVVTCLDNE